MSLIESKNKFDRFNFLLGAFYFVFVIFLIKVVNMQIIKHKYYLELAERNRTQVINQSAPRGKIISSDNVVLASNKPSYSLIYFPERSYSSKEIDKISLYLARYTNSDIKKIKKIIERAISSQKPLKVAGNLGVNSIIRISELKNLFPGFQQISEAVRYYPYGAWISHLIGYMGKIDSTQWSNYYSFGYSMDSLVGKTGIEKMYEKYLKGRDGGLYMEVDNRGRLIRIVDTQEGEAGNDIILTLNFKMQEAAEKALSELPYKKGAAIALDPYSGKILAYAVKPGFDLNSFVDYSEDKKESSPDIKEFNIGVQGTYPPASTFKIITSIAILESGKPHYDEKFFCPGFFDAGNRVFKCWEKKGHKYMDLKNGLANSCDVYFYNAALKVGPLKIEKTAEQFGFGEKTESPFPGENSGHVFGPKKRAMKKSYWFIGDTLNLAIGQGETLVTPMQMAVFISAIASRGLIFKPYYVDKIVKKNGDVILENFPKIKKKVKLKEETWEKLYEALGEVVSSGTGQAMKISGLEIFGKTGTAQNPHGKDHAWFVCFAKKPKEDPKVAVAVLVEHGEHGSTSALSVAKSIVKAAYPTNISDGKEENIQAVVTE